MYCAENEVQELGAARNADLVDLPKRKELARNAAAPLFISKVLVDRCGSLIETLPTPDRRAPSFLRK